MQDNELVGEWLSLQWLQTQLRRFSMNSFALRILNFMHFLVSLLGQHVPGGLRVE